MSQLIPALKIGFLITYFGPLGFVLLVTIGKEAYDDYKRYLRDLVKAVNFDFFKLGSEFTTL